MSVSSQDQIQEEEVEDIGWAANFLDYHPLLKYKDCRPSRSGARTPVVRSCYAKYSSSCDGLVPIWIPMEDDTLSLYDPKIVMAREFQQIRDRVRQDERQKGKIDKEKEVEIRGRLLQKCNSQSVKKQQELLQVDKVLVFPGRKDAGMAGNKKSDSNEEQVRQPTTKNSKERYEAELLARKSVVNIIISEKGKNLRRRSLMTEMSPVTEASSPKSNEAGLKKHEEIKKTLLATAKNKRDLHLLEVKRSTPQKEVQDQNNTSVLTKSPQVNSKSSYVPVSLEIAPSEPELKAVSSPSSPLTSNVEAQKVIPETSNPISESPNNVLKRQLTIISEVPVEVKETENLTVNNEEGQRLIGELTNMFEDMEVADAEVENIEEVKTSEVLPEEKARSPVASLNSTTASAGKKEATAATAISSSLLNSNETEPSDPAIVNHQPENEDTKKPEDESIAASPSMEEKNDKPAQPSESGTASSKGFFDYFSSKSKVKKSKSKS